MNRECLKIFRKLKREYRFKGSEIFQDLYLGEYADLCVNIGYDYEDETCAQILDHCLEEIENYIYTQTQESLQKYSDIICVYRGGELSKHINDLLIPVTLDPDIAILFADINSLKFISKLCVPKKDVLVNVNKIMGRRYGYKEEKELMVLSNRLRTLDVIELKFSEVRK